MSLQYEWLTVTIHLLLQGTSSSSTYRKILLTMTLAEFLLTQRKRPEVHMPAKTLIEDRYSTYLYFGCKVLYTTRLDDVVLLLYCSPAVNGV